MPSKKADEARAAFVVVVVDAASGLSPSNSQAHSILRHLTGIPKVALSRQNVPLLQITAFHSLLLLLAVVAGVVMPRAAARGRGLDSWALAARPCHNWEIPPALA